MIQAIIIDDEALILDNLTYIFQQLPDTRLLGAYQDPSKALADYPSLHPDVVIVDINMPYINGLEFAEKLRELERVWIRRHVCLGLWQGPFMGDAEVNPAALSFSRLSLLCPRLQDF